MKEKLTIQTVLENPQRGSGISSTRYNTYRNEQLEEREAKNKIGLKAV